MTPATPTPATPTIEPAVTPAASRYVVRDPQILEGEPIVAGTEVAVSDVVWLWKSGVDPKEIPTALFDRVTVAQMFDALSFYYDNQPEIDQALTAYASHPDPIMRLNPAWDEVVGHIEDFRQAVDAESEL